MTMRSKIFLPLLVAAVASIALLVVRLHGDSPDYNIILICIDTLRADHLGCYGYHRDTSPNIDRLAGESLFFENAYSTTAWTFPSHFSMFTSRYPNSNDQLLYPAVVAFDDSYVTMAEVLKSEGYQTAAFVGGGWVAGELGFQQGFDTYVSHGRRFERNRNALFKWLADHASKGKFLLFIHGFNTHRPYDPPKHLKTKFIKDADIPDECRGITFVTKQLRRCKCVETEQGVDYLHSQYDAEIFNVDITMGQIFEKLKEHGVYDNSIIIITSDHGEELLDHGRFDHVKTLYEELIRVPLIIRLPGLGAKTIGAKVSNLDLLPTVLDVLDIPYARLDIHGRSMRSLWAGKERDSDIYTLTGMAGENAAVCEGAPFIKLSAIRRNLKLIIKIRQDDSTTTEVFDLAEDPHERNNLIESSELAGRVDLLERLIQEWARSVDMELDLYDLDSVESELSPETVRQLKSLGYLN